jgi:hypothetical protein
MNPLNEIADIKARTKALIASRAMIADMLMDEVRQLAALSERVEALHAHLAGDAAAVLIAEQANAESRKAG